MCEFLEITGNAPVEVINLRLPLRLEVAVASNRAKECRGEGSVDALEELEEDERDGIATGPEAVSARVRQFFGQALGPELGKAVAEGCQAITGSGTTKRVDDFRVNLGRVNVEDAAMCAKRTSACIRASWRGWSSFSPGIRLPLGRTAGWLSWRKLPAIDKCLQDVLLNVLVVVVNR